MKFTKIVLATILATTAFASTSALAAYTRSCEGEVALHVKSASGQYIGNALVREIKSCRVGSPNGARSCASREINSSLYSNFSNNQTWALEKTTAIVRDSPSGRYNVEVILKTYSNNPGGDACNRNSSHSFVYTK